MNDVLLSSVELVKQIAGIADNVADEYIIVSIREAQEMGLKRIIGSALLSKLKQLIADDAIDAAENGYYKELANEAQYYLAYTAIVETAGKTSFKISNFGVVRTSDDHVEAAPFDDVVAVKDNYQHKADSYCRELQGFILENLDHFPEVDEDTCYKMRAHLFNAATCGIWLGGARGRR